MTPKKKPYPVIPRRMLVETAPVEPTEDRAPDVLRRKVPRQIGNSVMYFIKALDKPTTKDGNKE